MRAQSGFSLLELSVALIIIGVVMVPLFHQIRLDTLEQRNNETKLNISIMVPQALANFTSREDRRPCPANPTLTEADSGFGLEDRDPATGLCGASTATGTAAIRGGAIPFKTLNIDPTQALDGWNNKITYVVTTTHTVAGGMDTNPGTIQVAEFRLNTNNGNIEQIAPGDPASYLLISHGRNGVGAYTPGGVLAAPCPATGPALLRGDAENCDGDAAFVSHEGDVASLAPGVNYYDDYTKATAADPADMFSRSGAGNTLNSIHALYGINNNNPQTELDVVGNTKAGENAHAVSFCTTESDDPRCFTTEIIAGTGIACSYNTDLGLPSGFMTGIAYASPNCNAGFNGLTPTQCASGEYLSGISATGEPICSSM